MLYARGLYPTTSRLEHMGAFAFKFRFVPTLEHINHLEVDVVIVRGRRLFRLERRNEADHMRLHHAAGGSRDTQIAIAPQRFADLQAVAAGLDLGLTAIGELRAGRGVTWILNGREFAPAVQGYDHFR